MDTRETVWAVVVAAGRGERFGKPYNKVFHRLDGQSILKRSLNALAAARVFDGAVLVISEQDEAEYDRLVQQEGQCPLVRRVVRGGDTRQVSVLNGLLATPVTARLVAVHDAARPFAAPGLIRELVEQASREGSAIPGTPMTDTVKYLDAEGYAVDTPDRGRLCAVQTPQVFERDSLLRAHLKAQEEGMAATDDASVYERYVGRVCVVMRPECGENIKVTTQKDVANALMPPRIGQGYDAHRLEDGRRLVLCGVEIPWDKGLLGHSDADVALHALMDALLGAAGLGDIGRHFPDSDMQYKDISSMTLLEQVLGMLRERALLPVSVDVTIVAQRPKLKDFMPQMKANLCSSLMLPEDRVNVKATTTERMGFEGEGVGISAQAVALLISSDSQTKEAVD